MPKNIKACLTSNTDDWRTPSNIYKWFMDNNYIDCFKFKSKENELQNNYKGKKLFINPPISKLAEITPWIIDQANRNVVALLIPARTDTKYFHKLLELNPFIWFIKGRLHYNDSKSAPFPTILLIFNQTLRLPIYNQGAPWEN